MEAVYIGHLLVQSIVGISNYASNKKNLRNKRNFINQTSRDKLRQAELIYDTQVKNLNFKRINDLNQLTYNFLNSGFKTNSGTPEKIINQTSNFYLEALNNLSEEFTLKKELIKDQIEYEMGDISNLENLENLKLLNSGSTLIKDFTKNIYLPKENITNEEKQGEKIKNNEIG